jgi:hypothetical protein
MSKVTLCRLFSLEEGDRFYFVSDRSRHIWQVSYIETTIREPFHQAAYETQQYVLEDDNKKVMRRARNQEVMLIRKGG